MPLNTSGLDALLNNLASLQAATQNALAERLAAQIAANWSAHSPAAAGSPPAVASGDLAASIQVSAARVGTNLAYGHLLEFGTLKMAARPWLRPAVEQVRGEAGAIVSEVLDQQTGATHASPKNSDP